MRITFLFLDLLSFIFGERRVLLWCASMLERGGHMDQATEVRAKVGKFYE